MTRETKWKVGDVVRCRIEDRERVFWPIGRIDEVTDDRLTIWWIDQDDDSTMTLDAADSVLVHEWRNPE